MKYHNAVFLCLFVCFNCNVPFLLLFIYFLLLLFFETLIKGWMQIDFSVCQLLRFYSDIDRVGLK